MLPKCLALLIGWKEIDSKRKILSNRLKPLKSLITGFYKYAYPQQTMNDFIKELITKGK